MIAHIVRMGVTWVTSWLSRADERLNLLRSMVGWLIPSTAGSMFQSMLDIVSTTSKRLDIILARCVSC